LCGEPVPSSGGYGSGALRDGLYCSLTCYTLRNNRYVPPLADIAEEDRGDDDER
jgi:hypothetical protein